jgi:TPR repeat protein
MKPDLPPPSPLAFHPTILDATQENRLKLPNGRMVELVSSDPEKLEEYCQANFGKSWPNIRCDAEVELATRLCEITDRMAPLEALLQKGQPPETLIAAYGDIWDGLEKAYGDGSLKALLLMGHLSLTIGENFPPLAKPGAGLATVQMAIDLGYVAAYCYLGDHFLKEGRAQEATEAYQQGAEKGCRACLYQLGHFAERGVGGVARSDRAAFDLYLQAAEGNYPPADVAMAKLWLQHPHKLLQPENMTAVLRACVEMRCDGAEMVLADAYLRSDSSSETKRRVMSLYRCAAAYGDVDAQMKLARLLAGKDLGVLDVQVDSEEAERWYLCVCGSEYTSPAQAARANFELAQLFMSNGKYIQAAGHFHRASGYVPEAEYQQLKCERYGEANFFSQGGGVVDE